MDNEKIKELAEEYVEDALDEWCTKERQIVEPWHCVIEDLSHIAVSAIQKLLETHCIVEKKVIQDDYADVKKAVADWESSELTERDDYFEYGRVFGYKEVLESYFSKDDLIGKETEK